MKHRPTTHGQPLLLTVLCLLAVGLGFAIGLPAILDGQRHGHSLTGALHDVRHIKFALDGFATDYDGQFPNRATAEKLRPGMRLEYSNDYLRQLFFSGETGSEGIFWVKGSRVCRETPPDDIIMKNGVLNPSLILEPGDVHWAYLRDQTNTSNVERPLLMEGFPRGTVHYDPALWDRKVIVLRIDGSAKAVHMADFDNRVPDRNGNDVLSRESAAWKDSAEDPLKLLVQPEPMAE